MTRDMCYPLDSHSCDWVCGPNLESRAAAVCTNTSTDTHNAVWSCDNGEVKIGNCRPNFFCSNNFGYDAKNFDSYAEYKDSECGSSTNWDVWVPVLISIAVFIVMVSVIGCYCFAKRTTPEQRKNRTRGTPPVFPEDRQVNTEMYDKRLDTQFGYISPRSTQKALSAKKNTTPQTTPSPEARAAFDDQTMVSHV